MDSKLKFNVICFLFDPSIIRQNKNAKTRETVDRNQNVNNDQKARTPILVSITGHGLIDGIGLNVIPESDPLTRLGSAGPGPRPVHGT